MLNFQNLLKRKLAQGQLALGFWVTLEAPSITEIVVALGLDWIVIDAEHGHLDFKEVLEHVRVCHNTSTAALVRIQEIEQGLIKRMLDMGADGILVPQVYGPEEVERAVRFAKYPPWGIRGVGGERATRWGMALAEYARSANQETMVIPMMETTAAGEYIKAICDVPGVDAIYFGPADYSSSAGHVGAWEAPGVAETLLLIKDQARAKGKPVGISARDPADVCRRGSQGFQMIALASDTGAIIRAVQEGRWALPGQ